MSSLIWRLVFSDRIDGLAFLSIFICFKFSQLEDSYRFIFGISADCSLFLSYFTLILRDNNYKLKA